MRLVRSRVVYLLIVAAVMLYTAVVKGRNAELLMYGVILLPALTLVYALLTLPFIKVTVTPSEERPVKGDAVTVTVTVKNRFILPIPYLTLYTSVDRAISYDPKEEFLATQISLGPLEKRNLELDVLCRRHGYFTCGLTSLAVVDYLRLFRIPRFFRSHRLLIYPSVEGGGGALLRRLPSDPGTYPVAGRRGEIEPGVGEIRAYRPGDPASRLHHALSSRGLGLFTREPERVGRQAINLLYDNRGASPDEIDLLAHLASAMIYDATEADMLVRLLTGVERKCVGVRAEDYEPLEFLKAFHVISEGCREPLNLDLRNLDPAGGVLLADARLVIFTSDLDEELLLFASRAKDRGFEPAVIAVGDELYREEIFERLGLEVYYAQGEDDDPVWSLV